MLRSLIRAMVTIIRRLHRFVEIHLCFVGLIAVLHPLGFILGFAGFILLVNHTSWYLPFLGWSYAFNAALYLTSKGYRELNELGFDILFSAVNERYPS